MSHEYDLKRVLFLSFIQRYSMWSLLNITNFRREPLKILLPNNLQLFEKTNQSIIARSIFPLNLKSIWSINPSKPISYRYAAHFQNHQNRSLFYRSFNRTVARSSALQYLSLLSLGKLAKLRHLISIQSTFARLERLDLIVPYYQQHSDCDSLCYQAFTLKRPICTFSSQKLPNFLFLFWNGQRCTHLYRCWSYL